MKPIRIEPEFTVSKPSAYIDMTSVSVEGIDGEERYPWAEKISVEDLMKLLED